MSCPISTHGAPCGICGVCSQRIDVFSFRPGLCLRCQAWCCERCAPYDADGDVSTYTGFDDEQYSWDLGPSRGAYFDVSWMYCDRVAGLVPDIDGIHQIDAEHRRLISFHFPPCTADKLGQPFLTLCVECRQQCFAFECNYFPKPLCALVLQYFGTATAYAISTCPGSFEDKHEPPGNIAVNAVVWERWQYVVRRRAEASIWCGLLSSQPLRLGRHWFLVNQILGVLEAVRDEFQDELDRLRLCCEYLPPPPVNTALTGDTAVWVAPIVWLDHKGSGKECLPLAIAATPEAARIQMFENLVSNDELCHCFGTYNDEESRQQKFNRCRDILSQLLTISLRRATNPLCIWTNSSNNQKILDTWRQ